MDCRFQHQMQVKGIGKKGQERLKSSKVAVIGAGGLGSAVLPYLAAAGVGTIGVADDDVVEESNLARQVIYSPADLGRFKVPVALERLGRINPDVRLVDLGWIDQGNGLDRLADFSVVVDCTDSFSSKQLISSVTSQLGVPHVWGTVVGMQFQVSVFWSRAGIVLGDLYPQSVADPVMSVEKNGILGGVCGVCGSVMATEVIKFLTGSGDVLIGRLLLADLSVNLWRSIELFGS